MPHFQSTIKYLIATTCAALLLSLIPFSQREVATQRLEQEILRSEDLQKKVSTLCRELLPNENTPLERWFIGKLMPPTPNQPVNPLPSCILKAESAHSSQFNLLAQWSLGFQIFSSTSPTPVLTQTYFTQFPLPLSFLPLLTFTLLLPFTLSVVGALVFLGLHLLFLSGLNFIQCLASILLFLHTLNQSCRDQYRHGQ